MGLTWSADRFVRRSGRLFKGLLVGLGLSSAVWAESPLECPPGSAEVRIGQPSRLAQALHLDLEPGDRLTRIFRDGQQQPICGGVDLAAAEAFAVLAMPVEVERMRGGRAARLALPVGSIAQTLQLEADPLWSRFIELRELARQGQFQAARDGWTKLIAANPEHAATILAAAIPALEADFNFPAVLALLDQLIALRAQRGDPLPLQQAAVTIRGKLMLQMRRLDDCEAVYRAHLAIADLPPLLRAMNLQLRGAVTFLRGDLPAAVLDYQAAQDIFREQAPLSLVRIGSLSNLGLMATQAGQLEQASRHYDEALRLGAQVAPDSIVHARNLLAAGLIAGNLHHNALAAEHLLAANAAFAVLQPDGPEQAQAQSILAELLTRTGAMVEAEQILRAVVKREQARSPTARSTYESRGALAFNLFGQGRYDEAIADYEALFNELGERRDSLRGDLLVNYGSALAAVDRQADAITAVEQARAEYQRLNRGGLFIANAELLMGGWWLDLKRPDSAGPLLQSALKVVEKAAAGGLQEALVHYHLGRWQQASGHLEPALQEFRRALELLEALTAQQQLAIELRQGWAAAFAELYRTPIDLLIQQGQADAAFELYARYRQADARFGPAGSSALDASTDPHIAVGPSLRQQVAAGLDPGEVLVAYLLAADQLIVFVLDGSARLQFRRSPIQHQQLVKDIDAWRSLLGDPQSDAAQLLSRGRALRQQLFAPVSELLPDAAPLRIVADGALQKLAFAALPLDDGDDLQQTAFLAQAHQLSLQASGLPAAVTTANATARPLELLAFGDPGGQAGERARDRFVLRRDAELAPLPAARREAENAARVFAPAARALLGPQATRAALQEGLASSRRLHLATHAVVDPARPFDSWIALAGPPGAPLARLTAREIAALHAAPELVVLSACASADGADVGGAGVLGLVRAWQLAGAQQVVATQWSVGDRPSAQLMTRFWQHLSDSAAQAPIGAVSAALSTAQRDWLAQARAGWLGRIGRRIGGADGQPQQASHPFWWAGFVVLR